MAQPTGKERASSVGAIVVMLLPNAVSATWKSNTASVMLLRLLWCASCATLHSMFLCMRLTFSGVMARSTAVIANAIASPPCPTNVQGAAPDGCAGAVDCLRTSAAGSARLTPPVRPGSRVPVRWCRLPCKAMFATAQKC